MVNKGPKIEKWKKRKAWTGDGRRRTPDGEFVKFEKDTPILLYFKKIKSDFLELIEGISSKDILILMIIPFITGIFMIVPDKIRDILKLNIQNPIWWQYFTSNFVHNNFDHYISNIVMFLIFFGVQMILVPNNYRRKYYIIFFFAAFSFAIIGSTYEIFQNNNTLFYCGSSGIVSVIIGFTPVIWIEYFAKNIMKSLKNIKFFAMVCFYMALSLLIVYYPYHKSYHLTGIFISILLVLIYSYRREFKDIFNTLKMEKKFFCLFLLLFLILFFLIFPKLMFPFIIIKGDAIVAFDIHYFGLIYGFVVSYLFFKRIRF